VNFSLQCLHLSQYSKEKWWLATANLAHNHCHLTYDNNSNKNIFKKEKDQFYSSPQSPTRSNSKPLETVGKFISIHYVNGQYCMYSSMEIYITGQCKYTLISKGMRLLLWHKLSHIVWECVTLLKFFRVKWYEVGSDHLDCDSMNIRANLIKWLQLK